MAENTGYLSWLYQRWNNVGEYYAFAFIIYFLGVHYWFLPFCQSQQVNYLNDFATKLKLNVQYNTDVKLITKQGQGDTAVFLLQDQNGTAHSCRDVIMR